MGRHHTRWYHRWPTDLKPGGKLRQAINRRDGYTCQLQLDGCTGGYETLDHIVSPLEGGEPWDPTNLRSACRRCNSKRGDGRHGPSTSQALPPSRTW